MADAVPISDVLCEAMEYLSKFGSNLRVRSDNLKEKKIRKDKLRNVHAVQKAANKVLLICELSKKSIQNVETSIKNVLKQIDLSQESTTSESGSSKYKFPKVDKGGNYEYIEYNSFRLRIRKKVDMKHYTSVKVFARKMPISMQDKYPVFIDCNLYRIRRETFKDLDENISEEVSNSISDNDSASLNDTVQKKHIKDKTTEETQNEPTQCNFDDSKSKSGKCEAQSDKDQTVSDKEKDFSKDQESDDNPAKDKTKSNITADQNNTELNQNSVSDTKHEMLDPQSNEKKASENKTKKNFNKKSLLKADKEMLSSKSKLSSNDSKSLKSKKFRHIKVMDDSSDSDGKKPCSKINIEKNDSVSNSRDSDENRQDKQTDKTENSREKEIINNISINEEDIDSTQDNTLEMVNDPHKINISNEQTEDSVDLNKHIKQKTSACDDVVELDDSSNESKTSEEKKKEYEYEKLNCKNVKKESAECFNKENDSNIEENSNKKDATETKTESVDNDSKPKSFIRCVSLDKLLKKDIEIPKTNTAQTLKISPKKTKNEMSSKKHEKSPSKHSDKKRRKLYKEPSSSGESSKENDEEYWKQKRKEVKQFKPKNFVICVKRLPELSEKYLCVHNLRRITKNGSIVCEVVQKLEEKNENQIIPDVNSAKNALLCDSDSDKSKDLADTPRKVKRALLKGSGSEKEENLPSPGSKTREGRKSKSERPNSASDKEGRENGTPELEPVNNISDENNELKSNENHKTPSKKIIQNVSTPPSKRKHIMESMHAKKMLLTYSSSSDTEDEQLRNVLKEIRDSLLKENSSNESQEKNKQTDVKSSTDSDGSSSKVKKMKNCDTSKGSSSENENNSKIKASITEDASTTKDTNNQIDENTEEKSNSSFKKMGCSKSVGSSGQNSDSDTPESKEKDNINGLTNLQTLQKRHRRRRSASSTRTHSSTKKTRSKMSKTPHISEEGFLKAEDSSEEHSLADSDVGEEVELPAVPMIDLNGDGIGHLAKDDLLGDSDSSSEHVQSPQEVKNEADSDDDGAVRARRRNKGHATISSDSEAGGSRKKEPNVKFSDFDDSDDDGSGGGKRPKRKQRISDSDASARSSSNDGKKKRRRIKKIDDSEGSGSETENEGRNKHGRKNIRKVMGKNQLEEATKKAAREEKERIARIAERQKLYNNLEFDESGKPDEVVLEKVVLDFDPETKEPLIEVDTGLVKKLKPHQANGIKFMWDACFESVKRIKKDKGSGCILAHCMGLGKTLQVVSLTHTLLIHSDLTRVNRVLVVCPLSTVLNWVNEFKIWLKHAVSDYEVDIYELSRYKQNSERAWQLQQWFSGGGVCVLGYEMFRNLSADNVKKFKKKMLKSFQESLVDPGPDLVVCDEGHLLKNEKTSLSQAMNRVKTLRRIVLTGTPLQNNLKEYYCMVQFVKPNLLGKYNEYLNRFVNPITNGQYTDSNEHDIRIMKRRSHVLHKMLDGAVQRRDYGVLAPFLPPKHEYVLFITLSEVQIKLYQHYLDNYSRRPLAGKSSGFLFPDFQSLQRIWTHPLVLKYNSERYEIMQQKKREREEEDSEGSLVDFIDDDSTPEESSTEESSASLSDLSDDSQKKGKKKKATKKKNKASARRGTRANPVEAEEDAMAVENDGHARAENPTEWWMSLVSEDELDDLRHSHKLVLLFDILRQCEAIGDKLLVFSQSLYSLDLIEHFLGKVDEATQEGRVDEKLNGHVGSWSAGVDYFRLDGSTSCENRSIWCKNFNREDNPRARLFLISTRAGGLGINLVAANRVVIFDVSWNPSHDVQSIFRVYRFGQKKPCYIYRFLAMGTMEEKIYERQVTKQAISKRVIDEQQIDRHYAENDLAELYKFEPNPPTPRELPPLPKDRLFAEILKEYEAQIYKYHEHDSLLENKEEETLTEEERKAAWEDFENEKTRPPPAPFSAYNMHNGMVPGLLAQQQQLAYAALAAMLRKDMPNINDDQIRNMLPLIYNSNPALMQKMSEIYKYAQPGMMGPGMVNPVLNPVAASNMALGGSSGLQYEPPWQRQQQAQQQMNLQRLMQHQQNYYAGGLGSRDPVAMALQQQRAREMMLGERGRPRGRPPGTTAPRPRAPHHSGDVVDLDSD